MNLLIWYMIKIVLRNLNGPFAPDAYLAFQGYSNARRSTKFEAGKYLKNYSKVSIGNRIGNSLCPDRG
jgi:hypothetical protein